MRTTQTDNQAAATAAGARRRRTPDRSAPAAGGGGAGAPADRNLHVPPVLVARNGKVKSLEELTAVVAAAKADGKTVVHCHGVFDLLHPGHLHHFQEARKMGDLLVVTVTQDRHVNKGPGRPVFNEHLRAESVAAIECVDHVAVNRWPSAVPTIRLLKPSLYVKGEEFRDLTDRIGHVDKEAAAVRGVGGRIAFTGGITFSSSRLLNRYFRPFSEEAARFLEGFRRTHAADEVLALLEKLTTVRVLVIGEAIIDEYHFCEALGKPSKSAIVSARLLREETYAGGALAIANHLAAFCGEVQLVTCLGLADTREAFIRRHLKPGVVPRFFYRDDSPTIVKRRYIEPFVLTKMFEIGFFNDADLPAAVEREMADYLRAELDGWDLVLVADFGHGLMTSPLRSALYERAGFLAVNTQTNSANRGFNVITKYRRADYVCIDQQEIRMAARRPHGEARLLLPRIHDRMKCRAMTVTLGTGGSMVYRDGRLATVPAFSNDVVDSVGAGDAFLAITSPCALLGAPPETIGFIGNAVGAMAIRIVGNKESIERVPLVRFITTLLK